MSPIKIKHESAIKVPFEVMPGRDSGPRKEESFWIHASACVFFSGGDDDDEDDDEDDDDDPGVVDEDVAISLDGGRSTSFDNFLAAPGK